MRPNRQQMFLGRLEEVLFDSFDMPFTTSTFVKGHSFIDWETSVPEMKKFAFIRFGYSDGWQEIELQINPDVRAEIKSRLKNNEPVTLDTENEPLEFHGSFTIWGDLKFVGSIFILTPIEEKKPCSLTKAHETREIATVLMEGEEDWKFLLDPLFKSDLFEGLNSTQIGNSEAQSVADIIIDNASPWRIENGKIIIDQQDAEWVLKSTPLTILAENLNWGFRETEWELKFESWDEE